MDDLRVEAEGETAGEAKWAALREIERRVPGIDRTLVQLQVVSEGERGLLGVGAQPARVVAIAPAEAIEAAAMAMLDDEGDARAEAASRLEPRRVEGESEGAATVRHLLELTSEALGTRFRVDVQEHGSTITATCTGSDLGLLIGKHGGTIDALQYLTNAVLHRQGVEQEAVIDAAGYRERRDEALASIARRAASQAVSSGRPVELDPMTSVERKRVHLLLKDDARVETGSDGSEPNRFVVVRPVA